MSTTVETSTEIRRSRSRSRQDQIDDLRRRIAATRWPEQGAGRRPSQGVRLAMLQELARYWSNDYDFGRIEARLNALPQFMTEIDGVEIHFIHVRSRARERAAADHHPRLAGLGDRDARRHRAADRPDGARRQRRRMRSTS